MYVEMIEKLHASNMNFFTYPSNIKVFTSLSAFKGAFLLSSNYSH